MADPINPEELEHIKHNFLLLCEQYNQQGKHLHALAKDEPQPNPLLAKVAFQHHEIGEQLKIVGLGLDELGGDPMMRPRAPGRKPSPN